MRKHFGRYGRERRLRSLFFNAFLLGLIGYTGCRDCRSRKTSNLDESSENRKQFSESEKDDQGTQGTKLDKPMKVDFADYEGGFVEKIFDSCEAVKGSDRNGYISSIVFIGNSGLVLKRKNGRVERWDLKRRNLIISRMEEKWGRVAVSNRGKYLATFSEERKVRLREAENLRTVWQKQMPCELREVKFAPGKEDRIQVGCIEKNFEAGKREKQIYRIFEVNEKKKYIEVVSSEQNIADWLSTVDGDVFTINSEDQLESWKNKRATEIIKLSQSLQATKSSDLHQLFLILERRESGANRLAFLEKDGKKQVFGYNVISGYEKIKYQFFTSNKSVILTADYYIGPVDPKLGYETVRYVIRWWDTEREKDLANYKITGSIYPVAVSKSGLHFAYQFEMNGCFTVLELKKREKRQSSAEGAKTQRSE